MTWGAYIDRRVRILRDEIATVRGQAFAARTVDRGGWAASTVYVVGDIATANGARWRCTTAHTSGATFLAGVTNWTVVERAQGNPLPPLVTGMLGPPHVVATTSSIPAQQVLNAYPIVLPAATATYDAAVFIIATTATLGAGAGLTFAAGLYPDRNDGTPGPDFAAGPIASFTTTPTQAAGAITMTFGSALTNPPHGRYWWASLYSWTTAPTAGPTMVVVSSAHGGSGIQFSQTASVLQPSRSLTLAAQTALPTTNAGTLIPSAGSVAPVIALRRSA